MKTQFEYAAVSNYYNRSSIGIILHIYNNVDDISVGAHSHKFHITICDIIYYILNKMGLTAV